MTCLFCSKPEIGCTGDILDNTVVILLLTSHNTFIAAVASWLFLSLNTLNWDVTPCFPGHYAPASHSLTVAFQFTVWWADLGSFFLHLMHFLSFCWCLGCKCLQVLWGHSWVWLLAIFFQWLYKVTANTAMLHILKITSTVCGYFGVLCVWPFHLLSNAGGHRLTRLESPLTVR